MKISPDAPAWFKFFGVDRSGILCFLLVLVACLPTQHTWKFVAVLFIVLLQLVNVFVLMLINDSKE